MTYTHGMLGRRRIASAYALAASMIAAHFSGAHASTITMASTPATVSVDGSHTGATIPSAAVGLNTAVWDGHLLDSATPGLVQQAGVQVLRFPGGSTADAYHWQTNSLTPGQGGYVNPSNSFTNFMQRVAIPAGSQPMITVNYGSNAAGTGGGLPSEAAAWVHYANVTNHYGIKYWEVGNEVYGNGYYGASWETDLHADHSPTAYAYNALQYIQAMKAADPSIKVGLVLCAPGNWPDGAGPQNWNNTVLSIAGRSADFVSVHWYAQNPGQETDSGLLNSTASIPNMVSKLRSEITQYTGTHASQMGIMVTESNSVSYNPGKQTTSPVNGLFLLQNYLTWLQQGVQNVTWWDLRNGGQTNNNNSTSLAGTTAYGDYGVVSSGVNGEPGANTPFPTFSALQLLKQVAPVGSTFLSTSSSNPDVRTFALHQPTGSVALALVNASAWASYAVQPTLSNLGSIVSAQASSFSLSNSQVTTASLPVLNGAITVPMPPYSATVVTLSTGTVQAAPPLPVTATAVPTSTATSTPTQAPTTAPTATATPTVTAAPTSTPSPAPTPTATATQPAPTNTTGSSPLVLGNFEGTNDGFIGNSDVTANGSSWWSPTVALGSSSMWLQYKIPTPWAEAQIYKVVNQNLNAFTTLSVSVFPKQPLAATSVKVRFMAQGSNGQWYSSPYQMVPAWIRTKVTWNMSAVPRAPLKMVYVCWQFTSGTVGVGNELWMDDIQVS